MTDKFMLHDTSELTAKLTDKQRNVAWYLAYKATGIKDKAALNTFDEIERYFALVLNHAKVQKIKFHLASLLYATFISIGFFVVLYFIHDEQKSWCDVYMGNSTATMPCTELNEKVYEVTL